MPVNKKDDFVLAAAGDALVTRPILPYEGVSDRFDQMINHFREADATVLNLETVVHDYQSPNSGTTGTAMRTPPEVVEDLADMGCDMVSAANNHMYDYGIGAMKYTMEVLRDNGIHYAGLGNNLFEARKPAYYESPAGRVALVSTTELFSTGFDAGQQTPALPGRPGVNPLDVETIYRLPKEDLERLKTVSEHLGLEDIKQAWLDRGFYSGHDWNQEEYFHFSDMKFEEVDALDDAGITYKVNEKDREDIRDWIREANKSADWVIASIHSHKSSGGKEVHTETPPQFLVETARQFVDAGADSVIMTGSHVLRGIEVYKGKPIFYSLGKFIDQRPTVTRFPPEMYDRYEIDDYTKPSKVFDARLLDSEEEPTGDLVDTPQWETVMPICTFDESQELDQCKLLPVTQQQEAPRSQRGIPVLAIGEQAERILKQVSSLSSEFNTDVTISDGVGII